MLNNNKIHRNINDELALQHGNNSAQQQQQNTPESLIHTEHQKLKLCF